MCRVFSLPGWAVLQTGLLQWFALLLFCTLPTGAEDRDHGYINKGAIVPLHLDLLELQAKFSQRV